jgi:radical SAM superfamily enzyme YgiQ (UPF0313 family)
MIMVICSRSGVCLPIKTAPIVLASRENKSIPVHNRSSTVRLSDCLRAARERSFEADYSLELAIRGITFIERRWLMKLLFFAMPDRVVEMDWAGKVPNLGLMSIAGNIDNCEVKICDLVLKLNVKFSILRTVKKTIAEFDPDIVGLSAMTFQYKSATHIAKLIRSRFPKTIIVLGGYHATLAYDEIARGRDAELFDFIVRGEGEFTFREFIEAMRGGDESDFSKIKGLSYKKNGSFIHNEPRELADLTKIRLPNRRARIYDKFVMLGMPGDVVETSRGCTMNCKFCCITQMYGRSYRGFSNERIIQDIETIRETGREYIFFTDDNITLNPKRFDSLLDAIIASGNNDLKYGTQASSVGIGSSEERVRKMKEAGFDSVFLGAENLIDDNLEFLGKGDVVNHTVHAIEYLHKYKILSLIGIIAGNPEDDAKRIKANLDALKKLKCYLYLRFVLTPHIGTKIRDELLAQNLVVNKTDYSKYDGFCVNVRTKHLSRRKLELAIRWEQVKAFFYGTLVADNLLIKRYPKFFYASLWMAILRFFKSTIQGMAAKNH